MYSLLVIGGTGQGKSPYVHNYIKDKNCCVFDVQNEYGQRTKYPGQVPINLSDNIKDPRCRVTELDEDKFIDICATKKNTVCVFEEAMGFFEGRTSKKLRRLILGKIHTGNIYIFIFHLIDSVPPKLFGMADYAIVFKTGDEYWQVEKKYPRLLSAYNKLQTSKQNSHINVKLL